MTHKLKALGLALMAVFAIGAVAASSASATSAFFETDTGGEVTLTGEQTVKHEFKTVAGVVKCNVATFHGTLPNNATEVTITPHYTECTLAGLAATVNFTKCDYTLTAEETEDPLDKTTAWGTVHVVCGAGEEIHVAVVGSICEVTVEAQTLPAHSITLKNTAATGSTQDDVDVIITGTKIKYNIKNGNKCPNAPESKTYTDGTYNGQATFKGETPITGANQIGITVT